MICILFHRKKSGNFFTQTWKNSRPIELGLLTLLIGNRIERDKEEKDSQECFLSGLFYLTLFTIFKNVLSKKWKAKTVQFFSLSRFMAQMWLNNWNNHVITNLEEMGSIWVLLYTVGRSINGSNHFGKQFGNM